MKKANLILVKCFFSKSSSRTVKYQNHDQGEGNFSKKNAESHLKESPKSTKVKKPKEDQQFAQEAENISESPSRILSFVIS